MATISFVLLSFRRSDSFKRSVRAGRIPEVEPIYEEAIIRQASQPRRKKGGDTALFSRDLDEIVYANAISSNHATPPGKVSETIFCKTLYIVSDFLYWLSSLILQYRRRLHID
jgi:hypothetical protein